MKVLGIGESVIDEISVIGASGEVERTGRDAGGPVLVAMLMLAKLGADCTLVTTLGKDDGGVYIREILEREQVALRARLHDTSKINIIVVDGRSGQREKIHSDITHTAIADLEPAFLNSYDLIVMDRHEPEAFEEVRRHMGPQTKLITDPSTELSEFTLELMRASDCPIVPIETLAQLEDVASVEEAATRLQDLCAKTVVVTLGEHGCLVHDGWEMRMIPALDVVAVNTLGAGDVYRAAFGYGRLQGWGIEECARYGNAAAALQCTVLGNAADVPAKHEVDSLLRRAVYREADRTGLETSFAQLRRQYLPLAVK